MKLNVYIMISVFSLSSCASSVNVFKIVGESATIDLKKSVKYQVEILAVTDSTFITKKENLLYKNYFSEIKSIHIHSYRINRFWKILSAMPALFIDGIGLFAGFEEKDTNIIIIAGIATTITIYGFLSGDPKVRFSPPLNENDLEKLRPYCRYPQGLKDEQWRILLLHHNQKDFENLFTSIKEKK